MTTAINSRSSVSPAHSEELDPAARPAAGAPPPPRKSGNEPQPNRIESWSGPASSAPARRTAEEVNGQLDKLMKKTSSAPVRDFFVTGRDAREAVAMLGDLPSPEYKKALETMHSKTLGQLVCELDPDSRRSFLEQARQKGVVREEPGTRMPPREGSPPDKPALLRNDGSLRTELRTAIHAENVERTSQYMREFDGYLSRYSQAARAASSPLALRLIGPPATEFVLLEPGVGGSDRGVPATLNQGTPDRARAARAANDRISDFAGRTRAGSWSATMEAKVDFQLQGHGGEATFSGKLADYGRLDHKLKGEAEVALVKGLSAGVTSEGKHYQELNAGDFRARREGGKLNELEGKVAGFGVSLTQEKTSFSLGAGPAIPAGVFATIDEQHGSYGAGMKVGGKQELGALGSADASVKLGFSVQGVAPERLPDIASMVDDGIWGPMPELSGNLKWEQIPPPRRERLGRDGWSPSNWPVR